MTKAPLGRDVLAELRKSCDQYGIKLALYLASGRWRYTGSASGGRTTGGTHHEEHGAAFGRNGKKWFVSRVKS